MLDVFKSIRRVGYVIKAAFCGMEVVDNVLYVLKVMRCVLLYLLDVLGWRDMLEMMRCLLLRIWKS